MSESGQRPEVERAESYSVKGEGGKRGEVVGGANM